MPNQLFGKPSFAPLMTVHVWVCFEKAFLALFLALLFPSFHDCVTIGHTLILEVYQVIEQPIGKRVAHFLC